MRGAMKFRIDSIKYKPPRKSLCLSPQSSCNLPYLTTDLGCRWSSNNTQQSAYEDIFTAILTDQGTRHRKRQGGGERYL